MRMEPFERSTLDFSMEKKNKYKALVAFKKKENVHLDSIVVDFEVNEDEDNPQLRWDIIADEVFKTNEDVVIISISYV